MFRDPPDKLSGFLHLLRRVAAAAVLLALTGCPLITQQYMSIEDAISQAKEAARGCGATPGQIQAAIDSLWDLRTRDDGTSYRSFDDSFEFRQAENAAIAAGAGEQAAKAAANVAKARFALEKLKRLGWNVNGAADNVKRAEERIEKRRIYANAAGEAAIAAQQFQGFGDGTSQRIAAEIAAISAGADPDVAEDAARAAVSPNTHLAAMEAARDPLFDPSDDARRAMAEAIPGGVALARLADALDEVKTLDNAIKGAGSAAYNTARQNSSLTPDQASAMSNAMMAHMNRIMDPTDPLSRLPPSQRTAAIEGAGIFAAVEEGADPAEAAQVANRVRAAAMKVLSDEAAIDVRTGAGWPTEAWLTVQEARQAAADAAVGAGFGPGVFGSEKLFQVHLQLMAENAVNAKAAAYRQAETNASEAALTHMRSEVQTRIDSADRAKKAAAEKYLEVLKNGGSPTDAKSAARKAAGEAYLLPLSYKGGAPADAASRVASDIVDALSEGIGGDPTVSLAQADRILLDAPPKTNWTDEDWSNWENRVGPEAFAYGSAAAQAAAIHGADVERESLTGPGSFVYEGPGKHPFEKEVNALAGNVHQKILLALSHGRTSGAIGGSANYYENNFNVYKEEELPGRGEIYEYTPEGYDEPGLIMKKGPDRLYGGIVDIAQDLATSDRIVSGIDSAFQSPMDWSGMAVLLAAGTQVAKEKAYGALEAAQDGLIEYEARLDNELERLNIFGPYHESAANQALVDAQACRSQSRALTQAPAPGGPQVGLPGLPVREKPGVIEEGTTSVAMWQARNRQGVNFFNPANPTGDAAAAAAPAAPGVAAAGFSGTYTGNFVVVSDPTGLALELKVDTNNPHSLTVTLSSITIAEAGPFFVDVTGPLNADGKSFANLTGAGVLNVAHPVTVTATNGQFAGSGGPGSTLQFRYTVTEGPQVVVYDYSGVK